MSQFQRRVVLPGPGLGPATKALLVAILAATLIFTVTQRALGFGVNDLIFTVDGLLSLQLWRLVTFPFVVPQLLNLIIGLVVLYFFGRYFEAEWGSGYFLRFFMISSVGAAMLAFPLSLLLNLVFRVLPAFTDIGMSAGPGAAVDAMLVALAVTMPDSNILFGFVLPMRAKTAVYIFIGLQVVFGIMSGAAALSVTLGGMAMGYILTTGIWRPTRLMTRLRMWRLHRKRRGLHVVKPSSDKTFH